MSRAKIIKLQKQLEKILTPFENAMEGLSPNQTLEELEAMLQATRELEALLQSIKSHFQEVRNLLADTRGIPPAKELAQLIIGASSEALSSLREVQHHLEEFKIQREGRRRKRTFSADELHFAEFGSLTAIRRSHYIINKIAEHLDEVPASE
jgi:hypothetical protein